MINCISGISLFLMGLLAYADDQSAPVDTSVSASSEINIIIFGIIFFGLILGYFAYFYWGRKKRKDGDKAKKE